MSMSHRSGQSANSDGLRGAGAVFLTKYGRGRSSDSLFSPSMHSPLAEESPGRGSFHVPTPGPGSYEPDVQRSMTSILRSNDDKPQPAFRSSTERFGYRSARGRFATADPIHLEQRGSGPRPRHAGFVQPSPTTFRRGNSAVLSTLGGSQ